MNHEDRDELADIIDHGIHLTHHAGKIADRVLASGYRKPCQITSVEHLKPLPVGSIAMDREGDPWRNDLIDGEQVWYCGAMYMKGDCAEMQDYAPFTVLHVGTV